VAITLSSNGYCEVSDIQALVQQFTIGASSDPNTTEVEGFVTQGFAEINAVLRGAGYAAPVAQSGGSLTVSSGNITVSASVDAGNYAMTFTGTGLEGTAKRGDSFTIAGDTQPYMVTDTALATDSATIAVYFTPDLELDATAAAVVTFTAGTDAANVLKQLNAHMAAIQTIRAAYSAAGEGVGDLTAPLEAERDRMLAALMSGAYDLPVIAVPDEQAHTISNVRLVRA